MSYGIRKDLTSTTPRSEGPAVLNQLSQAVDDLDARLSALEPKRPTPQYDEDTVQRLVDIAQTVASMEDPVMFSDAGCVFCKTEMSPHWDGCLWLVAGELADEQGWGLS